MTRLDLPYNRQNLPVTLPTDKVGQMVQPRPVTPAADVEALVAGALARPIGAPPLAQVVQPGQRVALIVDDYTRHTPVQRFLPAVLAQLRAAGVAKNDIRLVVALGSHRPMTGAEIIAKVGTEIAGEYEVVNTTTADQMIYRGVSANGLPVWLNRVVVEADIRIGLGMITPHLDAGFSGGAKIILPGVCGPATVNAFHALSAFEPGNQLGKVHAPLRGHLEQFVEENVPLHFIINVIITLTGDIYQCVAGHPIQAHRVGGRYAQAVFGAPVKRRYPVVVANCYPYDIDLWQSIKGAWAGDLLTAEGGTLILLTAAPEGNSTYPLLPGYIGRNPDELKAEIKTGQAEDAKQAATGVMFNTLKQRVNLALVSDGLTRTDAAMMGVDYYDTVEAAVEAAVNRLPAAVRAGSVGVLPQAGLVLPLIKEDKYD